MLASWSYDGSQILLNVVEDKNNLNESNSKLATSLTHYIPNMEFTLIDFKFRANLKWVFF